MIKRDSRTRPGRGVLIQSIDGKSIELIDDPDDAPDETVTIYRDRFERLRKAAAAWASEFDYPGDQPGWGIDRAGLLESDLEPIP